MRTLILCGVLLAGCATAPQPMAPADDELFHDDFSRFPIGMLSAPLGLVNPAVQEYHWLARRGVPLEPWENAIIYLDPWSVGEEDGRPYLEMHLSAANRYLETSLLAPSFVTGDPEWSDCTVEASVRPLSFDEERQPVWPLERAIRQPDVGKIATQFN